MFFKIYFDKIPIMVMMTIVDEMNRMMTMETGFSFPEDSIFWLSASGGPDPYPSPSCAASLETCILYVKAFKLLQKSL